MSKESRRIQNGNAVHNDFNCISSYCFSIKEVLAKYKFYEEIENEQIC